jgi:hypothetical protein
MDDERADSTQICRRGLAYMSFLPLLCWIELWRQGSRSMPMMRIVVVVLQKVRECLLGTHGDIGIALCFDSDNRQTIDKQYSLLDPPIVDTH